MSFHAQIRLQGIYNCFLSGYFFIFSMNKRLIAVGIFLGIAIGIAFFVGCPNKAIGCLAFDIGR